MAETPEAKVKRGIREWLKARGIYFAMPIGSGFGSSGVPDFLCCWDGMFVAIEAKAPGKRSNTSVLQDRQIRDIKAAGGVAVVVDNASQLDELANLLARTSAV